ncbi:hypothetical protein HWQ46_06755 [Shewanella sp. D64]|uniref:VC2046/SO_2500 family protein n=1 Tax=unclassified Shewanella TaxID=196818 RepID=UPI0022BA4497|nr:MULTISPECIES: VC2046/SO_2500 family protein [unclassified Shewanella]MEC4725252.1 hypothetical protein [Shewanella sp. D64]MEC4735902.1 hypothetical protein [Shewanella sp. E94]WBJ93130.1 hypothetical protein HWQ47_14240 [Shewanella sp. MTB7]
MRPSAVLINESQLGTRLNHAIDNDRRGEFALLLALLSSDARDMAQFQLQGDAIDPEIALRAKFELPEKQVLVNDLTVQPLPRDNSIVFVQNGARAFQLLEALSPEALVIRGNKSASMQKVLANCDYLTRQKYNGTAKSEIYDSLNSHFVDQLDQQRQMSRALV